MNTDADHAGWLRRVTVLLSKTIENGATPDEEKSAVQLAYQLTRQHGLDVRDFKAQLAMIGDPQRYVLTHDGFLVPAGTMRPAPPPARPWDGTERRRSAAGPARAAAASEARECPSSPSGQHRWVPYMRGTFSTGIENCAHCGARRS